MGTAEDNTRLVAGLESMAEKFRVPEEWVASLRESYAAYPEGERCFYETPEGRFARRRPTLTRVWVVDVTGAPDACQTSTRPAPAENGMDTFGRHKSPFRGER